MDKIKIGIVGYGNIGRGVEQAIKRYTVNHAYHDIPSSL